MILVDANILIYAYNTASPEHAVAREWLEATIARAEPVALPWSEQSQVHGPLVTDAELAALATEHDATVYTADRDFARFTGLRVMNPLAS